MPLVPYATPNGQSNHNKVDHCLMATLLEFFREPLNIISKRGFQ